KSFSKEDLENKIVDPAEQNKAATAEQVEPHHDHDVDHRIKDLFKASVAGRAVSLPTYSTVQDEKGATLPAGPPRGPPKGSATEAKALLPEGAVGEVIRIELQHDTLRDSKGKSLFLKDHLPVTDLDAVQAVYVRFALPNDDHQGTARVENIKSVTIRLHPHELVYPFLHGKKTGVSLGMAPAGQASPKVGVVEDGD
ncbi:unnamed protein product, partial [Amoebophrya sp. A120]